MNVVDSSGWLEYFADGPNASHFAQPLSEVDFLVVPSVTIHEVFKVLLRERGENAALQGAAAMNRAQVVELTSSVAISAAKLSLKHALPLADAIILATCQSREAVLWTQDSDFKDIPGVKFFARS